MGLPACTRGGGIDGRFAAAPKKASFRSLASEFQSFGGDLVVVKRAQFEGKFNRNGSVRMRLDVTFKGKARKLKLEWLFGRTKENVKAAFGHLVGNIVS